MTRKDFKALAAALAAVRPNAWDPESVAMWQSAVNAVANALSDGAGFTLNGNRRFDMDRFLAACNV